MTAQSIIRPPADLISVGYVTGAYGVQGWIKIHPYSTSASALLHAKTWWLGKPEVRSVAPDEVHDVERLEVKRHGEDVVARIIGIVGRDAAESLKGNVVQIQRSHFPVLSTNEFYWLDLIGLVVENLQGEKLGVVVDLIDNGAHPVLRVVQPLTDVKVDGAAVGITKIATSAREYLIPFIEHFVPDVDQKNKKITVDWGLDY